MYLGTEIIHVCNVLKLQMFSNYTTKIFVNKVNYKIDIIDL